MKSWKKLLCYLCKFNVQLHVYLKKWTLKFKPLYLRNCTDYFNKICSVCCVNTHIKSLKVWLKSILPWLKYSIFSRRLFFIGAPCRSCDNDRCFRTTDIQQHNCWIFCIYGKNVCAVVPPANKVLFFSVLINSRPLLSWDVRIVFFTGTLAAWLTRITTSSSILLYRETELSLIHISEPTRPY